MPADRRKPVTVDVEVLAHHSSMGRSLSYRVVVWNIDGSPTPAVDPEKEPHQWSWGLPLTALVGSLKDGERVRVTARRLSRAEGSRPRDLVNPFRPLGRRRRRS